MTGAIGKPLKMGLIGVGHGGSELLPMFEQAPQVQLVAATDIEPARLDGLKAEHPDVRTYGSVKELCNDPEVDSVWIATPNNLHRSHTVTAASAGLNIICYKPMGTTLREAIAMVDAADKHGVKLMIGGLHSFYGPFRAMRRMIASGEMGAVRAIHSIAYTDWMLAPRVPDEVDPSKGGGMFHRQAPHQVETLRFLGGGMVRSVRGSVGQWSGVRPSAGYYSALFDFEDGAVASMVYNGYGYFMTSELVPWGNTRGLLSSTPESRAAVRKGLIDGSGLEKERERKDSVRIGSTGGDFMAQQRSNAPEPWIPQHLGITVATCERGDIRQSAYGLYVYDDEGNREEPVEDMLRRVGAVEIEEFYDAVVNGRPLYHDGRWGLATMEAQMAILRSARNRSEVKLRHQVAMPAGYNL